MTGTHMKCNEITAANNTVLRLTSKSNHQFTSGSVFYLSCQGESKTKWKSTLLRYVNVQNSIGKRKIDAFFLVNPDRFSQKHTRTRDNKFNRSPAAVANKQHANDDDIINPRHVFRRQVNANLN